MKNRISIIVFLFLLSFLRNSPAQELTPLQQEYIGQIIETLTEQNENSEDVSVVFDDLLNYLQKPLNLNTASAEELADLHVLTPFQIAALIDYRKNMGKLQTIYEMLYIPGFRQQEVDLITPFVVCEEQAKNYSLNSYINQQAIVRYQRVLEEQDGYIPLSDSVLALDPDKSHYLGSPDKVYFRYRIDMGGRLKAGILAEKDPGEEFFGGSNPGGFDFYSGYVDYSNEKGILRQVVLGDYHVRMGQGLLAWSSFAYGKSSYISDISRSGEILKTSSSAEENRFLRGGAFTFGKSHFSLTAYASHHKVDALIETDTLLQEGYFTGFTATGYHATPTDLEKENSLFLTTTGINLIWKSDRMKVGCNGIFVETDKYLLEADQLYRVYDFSGERNIGLSADYRYLGRRIQFFGEAAYSNEAFALLNGLLFFLKPNVNLGILHRHYDKSYYSYWASAFGENGDVANEDGFFVGFEGRLSHNQFRFYSDIFSFPWLRYRVNTPSEGYEIFGEWERTFGPAVIYFRYKRQEKPINFTIENHVYEVLPQIKEQYRINSNISLGSNLILQNRVEMSRAGFRKDTLAMGFMIFQDVILRELPVPVDISLRVAYFHAEEYETRFYAYERDLLYAATSQMLYGKGWRYMLLLKWKPANWLSFWFKIGQTLYPEAETVSSGLSEIQGNHRTEVKLQMIVSL